MNSRDCRNINFQGVEVAHVQVEEMLDLEAVRDAIAKLMLNGPPSLLSASESLGISPRTLQRRLSDMGLSYSKVIDEVRFIKARQLIIKRHKLYVIATHLGYADAASFTRAFERWTGMSPLKYRKQFYK